MDEQLCLDYLESGLSLVRTTERLNKHRDEDGKRGHVGVSAVSRCTAATVYRSNEPLLTAIKAHKQEGGEAWALAGWRWVAQKMVLLGIPIPKVPCATRV
eukprot:COSAG05_NODE_79_length_21178_cov_133.299492_15_plen_100_part_00